MTVSRSTRVFSDKGAQQGYARKNYRATQAKVPAAAAAIYTRLDPVSPADQTLRQARYREDRQRQNRQPPQPGRSLKGSDRLPLSVLP